MSTTWTNPTAVIDPDRLRVAKGACTTGTEVATQDPDDFPAYGIDLKGIGSVTPYLEMSKASGTVTCASVAANDTVTVNGVVFTAKASGATGDQFNVGASNTACAANLAAAINASETAGVDGIVSATSNLGVVTITAIAAGTAGNSLTLASSNGTRLAVSGANLSGGTNIGAGATLKAWLLNPANGVWMRAPDLDLTATSGIGSQGFPGLYVPGPVSRLQFLPDTVGAACTVYLIGSAHRVK